MHWMRVLVQARALQSLHNVKMRKHWSKWSNTQPRLPHPMIYNIQSHPRQCHIKKKQNKTEKRTNNICRTIQFRFFFVAVAAYFSTFESLPRPLESTVTFFQFIKYAAHFGDIARSFILLLLFFFFVASLIWTHFRLFGTGVVDGWLGWFGWSPMQIYTWQIKGLCCPHSLLQRAKSTFSFLF